MRTLQNSQLALNFKQIFYYTDNTLKTNTFVNLMVTHRIITPRYVRPDLFFRFVYGFYINFFIVQFEDIHKI